MDFDKYETVLAVARTGSVHLAADELFLAPSTVSKHIRALEAAYNIKLFERHPKGLALTETGEIFLSYAERILSEHYGLVEVLEKAGERQEIRICAIPPLNMLPHEGLFSQFQKKYPHYSVRMSEAHGGEMGRLLTSGSYEIALCSDIYLDARLVQWQCISEKYIVALVHQSHPLSRAERISIQDLKGERFISLPQRTGVPAGLKRLCQKYDVDYRVSLFTEREENIVSFVADNLGIALVGSEYLEHHFPDLYGKGQVRALPLIEKLTWNFVLARAAGAKLSPPAAALWAFTREYVNT